MENFDTIRLKAATKKRLDDEQDFLRRKDGKKPPISNVVDLSLNALRTAREPKKSAGGAGTYADPNRDLHRRLEDILASDDRGLVEAFFERLQSVPPKRKAGGR